MHSRMLRISSSATIRRLFMWPARVENSTFLLGIYGHYPNLDNIEVTAIHIDAGARTLTLSFLSRNLPYKPPSNWEEFNKVLFQLQFFPIESIDLSRFDYLGFSTLRMWDLGSFINVESKGAMDLCLQCVFVRINKLVGLLAGGSN
ncbi:Imm50 family immunity protein [Mesorhizobium sp. J428]|uniref:Imm50 family immunity protein n=1 Tax=Mesorhizobium sp. J428 TaxID=2898440 RepID=UPI0035B0C996